MKFLPHFSIRDILLVTTIVVMAIGWWIDHRKWTTFYYEAADSATRLARERDAMEALPTTPLPTGNPDYLSVGGNEAGGGS